MFSAPRFSHVIPRLSLQRLPTSQLVAVVLACTLTLVVVATGRLDAAQKAEDLVVVVQEGETLRDLAGKHLQDSDLWEEILRFNQIGDVTEVVPGTKLKIPLTQIMQANEHLDATRLEIQRATKAGAKVFVPEIIDRAVQLYNEAILRRKAGAWEQAVQTASQAQKMAQDAATATMAKRDAKVEAILSDRQGTVNGRKPKAHLWSETLLRGTLIELEKIRTLSRSQAELTFWDESRLRLNENSQAIIRSMRLDLLKQKQETKVSLVSGDIYALLKGKSKKKTFDVDVKGIKMKNESRHFRVIREKAATKVTNYDRGQVQVTSKGGTTMIGKNQGVIVKNGKKPAPMIDLTEKPELMTPEDGGQIFQQNGVLSWAPTKGAFSYWLEIALDPAFRQSVVNHWGAVKETRFDVADLEVATYYWRVAAINQEGLAGGMSKMRRFTLQSDDEAPYLLIASPREGRFVRQTPISVRGTTEPDATLTLHGDIVEVGPEGQFEQDVELHKGLNKLTFKVKDQAGHVTERLRSVIYLPDQEAVIRYDASLPRLGEKHFVTHEKTFSLLGTTTAKWEIQVQSQTGQTRVHTFADESGHFNLNIPVDSDHAVFTLLAISPSGFVTKDALTMSRDVEAPTITVDTLPPAVTRMPEFQLQGYVWERRGGQTQRRGHHGIRRSLGRDDPPGAGKKPY